MIQFNEQGTIFTHPHFYFSNQSASFLYLENTESLRYYPTLPNQRYVENSKTLWDIQYLVSCPTWIDLMVLLITTRMLCVLIVVLSRRSHRGSGVLYAASKQSEIQFVSRKIKAMSYQNSA